MSLQSAETTFESSAERPLLSAQYLAFGRRGWLWLGLAALMSIACLRFAIVGEWSIAAYLGAAALACAGVVALIIALVGTLELTASTIVGRRRIGGFSIPRSSIAYIEPFGRRRRDTVGVAVVLLDGSRRKLVRVRPAAAIQTLLGAHPRPR